MHPTDTATVAFIKSNLFGDR